MRNLLPALGTETRRVAHLLELALEVAGLIRPRSNEAHRDALSDGRGDDASTAAGEMVLDTGFVVLAPTDVVLRAAKRVARADRAIEMEQVDRALDVLALAHRYGPPTGMVIGVGSSMRNRVRILFQCMRISVTRAK